jgi:hypothetical protein
LSNRLQSLLDERPVAGQKLERSSVTAPILARLRLLEFRQDHTPLRVERVMRPAQLTQVVSCDGDTAESEVAAMISDIAHSRERAGSIFRLKTMKPGSHPRIFSQDWDGRGGGDGIEASDRTRLVLEHVAQ